MAEPEQPLVWASGYGAYRHLVARGTRDPGSNEGGPYALAACTPQIVVSLFPDNEERQRVIMSKFPCKRCAAKVGQVRCPTCDGSGTVPKT